ncbi:MAG: hypothetical protein BEN19_07630 [Epulopiscium sp. Nuni2H_MBin003]|nr:MAG: hypothetical protein BEN19_07630 [Epulopiscium sp. Nuni2H_MBin003]
MENSFFVNVIKNSMLLRVINKVYYTVQNIWYRSLIYKIVFLNPIALNLENSTTYKIFSLPFTVLNKLSHTSHRRIIDESLVINIIKEYLYMVMRINTRLIGSFIAMIMLFYGKINTVTISIFIVAILLAIINVDLTEKAKESLICKLIFYLADFKIATIKDTKYKNNTLLFGLCAGVLTGILMMLAGNILGIFLFVALTGISFVFLDPVYGLYCTILAAPIFPTKLILGLCAMVILSIIIRNIIDSKYKWKLDDIGFIIIGLLLVYLISALFSFFPFNGIFVLAVYAMFIGYYIIARQLLTSQDIIIRCIKLFVLTGALVSAYGILQYIFGWGTEQNWIDPEVFETITKRAYSTLENPNILGVYLILTIMISAGVMFTRKTYGSMFFYACVTGVMGICLGATYSRGCWIGVVIAGVIFITFYNGRLWFFAIIAMLVAPFILPENIMIRLLSIGNMEDTSTAIRIKIWLSSLRMGKDFMLTGAGLGTLSYKYLYPLYKYYYIPAEHSHNALFQVFIEGGIIGLILFIFAIWRLIKHQAVSMAKKTSQNILGLSVSCGVIGFFVQGMFDYPFYNYRLVLIFWLVISFGVALCKEACND